VGLLLDTNALLWLLAGDDRLGAHSRDAVAHAQRVVVSVASLWEIAIKVSIGKLGPIPILHRTITELGFVRLAIQDPHLVRVASLPLLHKDPFDRLLVCQAAHEMLPILTADSRFAEYGVPVLDART
jgi:PIN domain nuclease of toxin-antitoxin system